MDNNDIKKSPELGNDDFIMPDFDIPKNDNNDSNINDDSLKRAEELGVPVVEEIETKDLKNERLEEPKIEESKVNDVNLGMPDLSKEPKKDKKKKTNQDLADIEDEIPKRTKRPKTGVFVIILDILMILVILAGIAGVVAASMFVSNLIVDKPEFDVQRLTSDDSTIIYDAEGNEIVELGMYLRESIEYEKMPSSLIDAFLSIEDSRFFEHFGFDIPRFTKAAISNLRSGGFGQGGSTVTMQLVKNSYFQIDADGESTLAAASGMAGVKRKMQEIVLAMECDSVLDKKEIISLYINKINFGNNIRGVQKAAEYYFGKDAEDLNLIESCFLAGIINSPNNYNPYNELYKYNESYIYLNSNITYLENAQNRTAEVLDLMVYHGYITQQEADLAKSVKIENLLAGVDLKFASYSDYYQDFIDKVIDEAQEVTGLDPYTTSMEIHTTMDPYMQELLYNIENEKTDLKYTRDLEQSALVVLNNQTGELVALGGGRYRTEGEVRQFNRATDAYLQPGSAIKPVLEYALAFDRLGWSTAHTITDRPYYLYNGNILVANAGGQGYTGDMLITEAIARSLNSPAVQTLEAVVKEMEEDGVKEYLESIGITRNLDTFDLQWAIGGNTCLVTPVQLAGAHAIFMRGGYYVKPHTIKKIIFGDGNEYVADTKGKQVISSAAAYMTATCEAYNVSGPFYNLMQILKRDYPVYAKTGTTDWAYDGRAYKIPIGAPKDMWMVCQTSNYTVTVWLGFDKAEEGAFFTSSEDMANLKGKMCKMILDELDNHFDYGPHAIERPDDVSDITIVKGAYPYCAPDGEHETATGLIKTSALEEHPLTSVGEVLANLPVKEDGANAVSMTGWVDEWGTATIELHGGSYYCSEGVQNISATNAFGKTTEATGRCYFPHYVTSYSEEGESPWAHLTLFVNGEYYSESEGQGWVFFYGVPQGEAKVCNDAGTCEVLGRAEAYYGEW